MHANAELIERFYSAFNRRDAKTMVACYGPNATFFDPVFQQLDRAQLEVMWTTLTGRAKNFSLTFSGVSADDTTGQAHWEADYLFSAAEYPVHNVIDARFTFKDGLIASHVDTFALYRWASQALGLKGKLLGWAPPVQAAIRKQARQGMGLPLK
jgi:ketosteroid isomerase-like protein